MDGQLRQAHWKLCLDIPYLYIIVSVLCFYGVCGVCVHVCACVYFSSFLLCLLPVLLRQREKEDKQLEGWGGRDNLEKKRENCEQNILSEKYYFQKKYSSFILSAIIFSDLKKSALKCNLCKPKYLLFPFFPFSFPPYMNACMLMHTGFSPNSK